MLILGIETSCDETGVALFERGQGLVAHVLHSQVAIHADYGGVVPELASRDHVRRLPLLLRRLLGEAGLAPPDLDGIAYTRGPGLAGALLVGAGFAHGLAAVLGVPAIPIHHLEGHLLSPLLSSDPPLFPFVALLVSGGHTQLMEVAGVGRYRLLGETVDDAAGEAFDKTATLLGLGYPGGPQLALLAERGDASRFHLPRPMLRSGNLDFSFSGLKTAVATLLRDIPRSDHADVAAGFQAAIVDVLVAKCLAALTETGHRTLVVAGGVGANRQLRLELDSRARSGGFRVHYPPQELCTDNGAMIALAGAMRLSEGVAWASGFSVAPRWDLESLRPVVDSVSG